MKSRCRSAADASSTTRRLRGTASATLCYRTHAISPRRQHLLRITAAHARALPGARRRQIHSRVAAKEPVGVQRKPNGRDGHDRKVLHPRHVRDAKGVPKDHVRVDERPVGGGPRCEASVDAVGGGVVGGQLLGGELAGGVPLAIGVRRHPQRVARKEGAAGDGAVVGREQRWVQPPVGSRHLSERRTSRQATQEGE